MSGSATPRRIEMWGGIECTVNRVGNRYFDQLELSGHASRVDDIDRIAGLGIETMRYPLLWERIAPGELERADWRWADERMQRMSDVGVTPIAGLVHHGSGPRHTSLLDSEFAPKLAEYADAVALRYPQLCYVTPVNEPLTTARFATLYGTWYPHHRSADSFARALLNQCVAIRDSFQAMKARIPHLELVQTEDLGRISSTSSLRYQADFENCRRWLTFDLLIGRVNRDHPMWPHLATCSDNERMLDSLHADPSPPDVIGINYYVTSDRFLDERLDLHQPGAVGGNGRHSYADIESVRALAEGITGHQALLEEAWERYRVPLAITEVHMGCTREHQVRWLVDAWNGARAAAASGCDIRAVTAWSLFGSFGWDTLVTHEPHAYECGAFDVRSSPPRETALAQVIRDLATYGESSHPARDAHGWWKSHERFIVPPVSGRTGTTQKPTLVRPDSSENVRTSRPILITGSRGTLGSAFERICAARNLPAQGASRDELDISSAPNVRATLEALRPWAVVNAAGYVRVDDAECDKNSCYRYNTFAVGILAAECARAGIPLVTFSSDLVFDGAKAEPYVESDRVSPLCAYGASKAAAELSALKLNESTLVIRTSAFFGTWDSYNFPTVALRTMLSGVPFAAASDCVVSPTYVPDLVNITLDLLIDGECGIWHLANDGSLSWAALAREVASRAGLSDDLVNACPSHELGLPARRPEYSALTSERGILLPSLDNALDRWFGEMNSINRDGLVALHT